MKEEYWVVGLYEDPKTKNKIAVKFETNETGVGNSPINQESVTFGILGRKRVDFKHVIKYYGTEVWPMTCIKMEYL